MSGFYWMILDQGLVLFNSVKIIKPGQAILENSRVACGLIGIHWISLRHITVYILP